MGKYRFPSPYWDYVSEDAKDLVRGLLELDVKKRLSAKQVLQHKWINKKEAVAVDLSAMYMEQLEHFSSSRQVLDAGLQLHSPPIAVSAQRGGQTHQAQRSYFANKQYAPKNTAWD